MFPFETLTVDRWIALASSLGTLIAAFLAAFSIREVRLQRSQQFQPRIAPTTGSYELDIDPEDLLDFDDKTGKYLPIINVGHGVATDLTVEWLIDLDGWVNKTNTLSAQRGAGVGVERDNFGLAFRCNGKQQGGCRVPEDEPCQFPYIVPVLSDRSPTEARLPGAIVALLNAYHWSYFRELGSAQGVYVNPAPEFRINLKLSYKDTVGRAYVRGSVLAVSAILKSAKGARPMRVQFIIHPVSNEPAEGYSTVTRILLRALKESITRALPI